MRGDIWTVQTAGYASKPRPTVVVQSDSLERLNSVVVCMFTTGDTVGGPTRVPVAATESNGLNCDCTIMADKPVTVRKDRLGMRVGRLDRESLSALDSALRFALDLR